MKLKIDEETGEILTSNVMVEVEKAPTIILDTSLITEYHKEPEKLVEIINKQAGFPVFDIASKKGRTACASHSANIIKCIAPAINEAKRLEVEAKKVINQGLYFRKNFELGVREIAAFHRKPLTEYEEELERVKAEFEELEAKRIEEENYQNDWSDALDFDELFTLRKEKQEAEELAQAKAKAIADKAELELQVAERMESLLQIEAEATRFVTDQPRFVTAQQVDAIIALKRLAEDDRKNPPVVRAQKIEVYRPTDDEILAALVFNFGCSNEQMLDWLQEMDIEPMRENLGVSA
jgi:hypothetical protein